MENGDGIRRCGAKLRGKPGQFCRSRVVMANGRCRIHGGKAKSGPAAPGWIDGRIAYKHLPKKLANGYKALSDDADLTQLREDLRLQWAMVDAALKEMDETEAPPWGKAVELLNDCKTAKSKDKFEAKFAELEQVIRTGKNAVAAYERLEGKIRELLQERTRTASAEHKRLVDLQALIELPKVMMVQRALFDAVVGECTDKAMLARIFEKWRRFMPPPSNQAIIEGRITNQSIEEQEQ